MPRYFSNKVLIEYISIDVTKYWTYWYGVEKILTSVSELFGL